ncbi:MAG TPA: UDP-N-acetylmuramate dehydrogenase [Clostridiales bacterium]|nr:UDP-N-acetylmuramate dehydrogenase [Clostridiales bacterium]
MNLSALKPKVKGDVLFDVPMRKYTTWHIGGAADCLVLPKDAEDIAAVIRFAMANDVPYTVIGNGSNLLVLDGGIRGIVIRIGEGMATYTVENTLVTAKSGCTLTKMARETAKLGLKGLEWAAGIPASIGGAAYMNAGAYGHFFYETLEAAEIIDRDCKIRVVSKNDLSYGYRHTSLMENGAIVTKAMIRTSYGDKTQLLAAVEETLKLRRKNQPLDLPSAGSVFKNPSGDHAGRLVEVSGLCGLRVGNAQVSEKHGNFIVNLGGCTAEDVLTLMDQVQAEVKRQYGVVLEPEVLKIGRP